MVERGSLPEPGDRPCVDCGHIGPDKGHQYDHFLGYSGDCQDAVQAVCVTCGRWRDRLRRACGFLSDPLLTESRLRKLLQDMTTRMEIHRIVKEEQRRRLGGF